ncbi:MAG: PAC2 family protein [Candidatus Thorarchaeota archaeon]
MYTRRFIDLDASSLKSPVAILGLPGIANVGRIAVDTLSSVLDAQPVMDFFSDDFPPRVFVKDGIANFPKSSIMLYRAAPDEPHDLIILSADFQPASGRGVFEYADFVVQEFTGLGVKEVYALAAYETSYQEFFESYPMPPRVFISASSSELLGEISTLDGTVATEEGVVNGANGFIPAWAASMYNMKGACLLGETLGMIKMDYRAARTVLEKISSFLDIKASFEILEDDVTKVIDFIEWAKNEISQRGTAEEDGQRPSDRYIG